MTSQSTIHCTICFFFLSQKVLIAQTQLNVLLGDINKGAFDRNNFTTIKAYLIMLRAILYFSTLRPPNIFLLFFHLHV